VLASAVSERYGIDPFDEPVVEAWDGSSGQLDAGARECPFRHMAHQLCWLLKVGKELVKLRLDALAHAAQHDNKSRGQR
jgi:hypothetical protein